MKVSEYLEKKRKENRQMEEHHEHIKTDKDVDHDLERIKKEEERIKELKKDLRRKHGTIVGRNWKKMDPWVRADIIQTLIIVAVIIVGYAVFTGTSSGDVKDTTSTISSGNFLTRWLGISGATVLEVNNSESVTVEDNTEKITEEIVEETTTDSDLLDFSMEAEKLNGDVIEKGSSIPGSDPYTSYVIEITNNEDDDISCSGTKEAKETGVKSTWSKKTIESGETGEFSWRVGAPSDEVNKVQVTNKITCNSKGETRTETISFYINFPQ